MVVTLPYCPDPLADGMGYNYCFTVLDEALFHATQIQGFFQSSITDTGGGRRLLALNDIVLIAIARPLPNEDDFKLINETMINRICIVHIDNLQPAFVYWIRATYPHQSLRHVPGWQEVFGTLQSNEEELWFQRLSVAPMIQTRQNYINSQIEPIVKADGIEATFEPAVRAALRLHPRLGMDFSAKDFDLSTWMSTISATYPGHFVRDPAENLSYQAVLAHVRAFPPV